MKRIYCNISPIKDLVEPTPTFEDMIAEEQKPIDKAPTLAELAAVLYPVCGEKD